MDNERNITADIGKRIIPKAAIIAYQEKILRSDGSDTCTGAYSLELRKIRTDGTMGPAIPASKEFIISLVSQFSAEDNTTPHGPVPENLIYADYRKGREKLIWYTPPGKRMRYFEKNLGIKDGEYCVPGCIFEMTGNSLQVHCFKGKRPSGSSQLLWGPFFNAYSSHICLGNARGKITSYTWQGLMDYWEGLFWNSKDAHLGEIRPTKDNLVLTIKKYKDIPFDCEELVKKKQHLKDIIPTE